MKIFCDMDGTIVDFNKGIINLTGRHPDDIEDKYMWPAVMKKKDFFHTLDWLPDGKNLWNYIKKYDPSILTGRPSSFDAQEGKRFWCSTKLGNHIEVIICLSKEKHLYCTPGAVLIDNRVDIGERWIAAGGRFILHNNANESIMYLKELGL